MIEEGVFYKYKFPLGTMFVNLTGSLLIGIIYGISVKHGILGRGTLGYYFLVTGFLGAYTTFSTFSQDNLILLFEKNYLFFISNILINVLLGLTLVYLGYALAKHL